MSANFDEICMEMGKRLFSSLQEELPHGSALGFSGGIDSSLLLYLSSGRVVPYNISVPGSTDYRNASSVAGVLGTDFRHIDLSGMEVKKYLGILLDIDPSIAKPDIGFELILTILLGSVNEEHVITGQGSDEIFYGYRRFSDDSLLTNRGHMDKLLKVTIPREKKLADYFGKELITPYLDSKIVELAAKLDKHQHVDSEGNKKVLRQAARLMGYPEELSGMPKKAAQYGSGIMKILRTIPEYAEWPVKI